MPADALGLGLAFVLVLGLLLAACLGLTMVLVTLLGLRVHAVGTLFGLVLAAVAAGGASLWTGDVLSGFLTAIGGVLLGVAFGRWRWPDADPPTFVGGSAYRLLFLAVGGAAIGAGLGVWVVLVGTAGPALALELFSEHPGETATLLVVTGVPIVGGATAIVAASSNRRKVSSKVDDDV